MDMLNVLLLLAILVVFYIGFIAGSTFGTLGEMKRRAKLWLREALHKDDEPK